MQDKKMLKPVVQEKTSGCGIAAVANIRGKTYPEMKAIANAMGIDAEDSSLWSDTLYVRRLLVNAGVVISENEIVFESWQGLPDLALLAIKYHREAGQEFWHWVVYKRIARQPVVFDSGSYLPSNVRTDFAAMQLKWFSQPDI